MTIQVERGMGWSPGLFAAPRSLELSPAALYEQALCRGERTWPLRGRSWPGPDSIPAAHRTTSLSSGTAERTARALGRGQQAD